MLKKVIKLTIGAAVGLVLVLLIVALLPRALTWLYALPRQFTPDGVEPRPVAIVFGAGLRRDGSPSPVLRDRVDTAVNLYFSGKVQKLLMSGDNRSFNHNEPGSMRDYAVSRGVPPEDIVLDYAGQRTYDTCYRARHIFKLDSAILVTQAFHLPRALYVCNSLGLPAVGVSADQRPYRRFAMVFWGLRETVATLVALWEVHITRPLPVLGKPEPIFPLEAQ